MKKFILVLIVALFPTFVYAQTPSLYDEWSPALAGTLAHFTISKNEIVVLISDHTQEVNSIISLAPAMPSADIKAGSDPILPKTLTLKLLKVVYDSGQSKGRFFVQADTSKNPFIIAFNFALKDNGEAEVGIASNPLGNYDWKNGKSKSLKEIERDSRPSVKPKKSMKHSWDAEMGIFSNFKFTFYNKTRTAEFAKLKDPQTMPKEEMLAMVRSFGDRMAANLQQLPEQLTNEFEFIMPLLKNIQSLANDLFVAHGYNPLGFASCVEKVKGDSDVQTAIKIAGEKIEESVPYLRKQKAEREARKEEAIIDQIAELNKTYATRLELIKNLSEQLKDIPEIDKGILTEISAAQKDAAFELTSEVTKDPKALEHFEKVQADLSATLSKLFANMHQVSFGSNEEIQNVVNQLESTESSLRLSAIMYNQQLKWLKPKSGVAQHQNFKNVPDELPMDSSMGTAPAPIPAPAPPPPPAAIAATSGEPSQDDFIEVEKGPLPLQNIQSLVVYPERAKKAGLEGKVTVQILIGKDGKVKKTLIEKSDNEIFNQSVLDAIKKVRFSPAKQNGKPVAVWYTQSVNFKLNDAIPSEEEK